MCYDKARLTILKEIDIAQMTILKIIRKSNQVKCWFLMRGENRHRGSRAKAAQSKVENQQFQSFTCGAKCAKGLRVMLCYLFNCRANVFFDLVIVMCHREDNW